nr:hypothetical protein [uncultured bacterium]
MLLKIEDSDRAFNNEISSTKMSQQELDLVKKLFAFSGGQHSGEASPELGTAYLVMGQYEKALSEFNILVKNAKQRVFAAKNILRCYIGMATLEDAILQYNIWTVSGQFSYDDLAKVYSFLQNILIKRNSKEFIPKPSPEKKAKNEKPQEDEYLDLLSIKINPDNNDRKNTAISLDVEFQKGNVFSVILPKKESPIIEMMKAGKTIKNVEITATSVVFQENCLIAGKRVIKKGPQKGQSFIILKILES